MLESLHSVGKIPYPLLERKKGSPLLHGTRLGTNFAKLYPGLPMCFSSFNWNQKPNQRTHIPISDIDTTIIQRHWGTVS